MTERAPEHLRLSVTTSPGPPSLGGVVSNGIKVSKQRSAEPRGPLLPAASPSRAANICPRTGPRKASSAETMFPITN